MAGEDSGGVHGANRLGGNGVANSTVFGGIAGDAMAAWVGREGAFRAADPVAVDAAIARAERPFRSGGGGDLEAMREQLQTTMWDDAGIVRDAGSLARAADALDALARQLASYALPNGARERAFNLTWHDWLNLTNLVAVSRAIVRAAAAREDSRGAHFRADFPETGSLAESTFIRVGSADGALGVESVPGALHARQAGSNAAHRLTISPVLSSHCHSGPRQWRLSTKTGLAR